MERGKRASEGEWERKRRGVVKRVTRTRQRGRTGTREEVTRGNQVKGENEGGIGEETREGVSRWWLWRGEASLNAAHLCNVTVI